MGQCSQWYAKLEEDSHKCLQPNIGNNKKRTDAIIVQCLIFRLCILRWVGCKECIFLFKSFYSFHDYKKLFWHKLQLFVNAKSTPVFSDEKKKIQLNTQPL